MTELRPAAEAREERVMNWRCASGQCIKCSFDILASTIHTVHLGALTCNETLEIDTIATLHETDALTSNKGALSCPPWQLTCLVYRPRHAIHIASTLSEQSSLHRCLRLARSKPICRQSPPPPEPCGGRWWTLSPVSLNGQVRTPTLPCNCRHLRAHDGECTLSMFSCFSNCQLLSSSLLGS